MAEATLREQFNTSMRFFRFALPQWKWMLVAFVAMFVLSVSEGGLLLLFRPVLDSLLEAEEAREGGEVATVVEEEPRNPASADAPELLKKTKQSWEGIKEGVAEWPPVAALRDYLDPSLGRRTVLKHMAWLVLLAIAPLWILGAFLETYGTGRVLWTVMADVRIAVFEKLSGMPLSFFSGRRTGDLISRLTNDITQTRGAAKMLFSDVIKHPMKLLVMLVVALLLSWQLTLIIFLAAPLIGLVMRRYGGRIQKYGRQSLEKIGDITESISQMFNGIRVVKAFGMEEAENEEFRERNRQQLKRAYKLVRNRALADSLPQLVAVICLGGLLLLANPLLDAKIIKLGRVVLLLVVMLVMRRSVKRVVKCYSKLRENLSAMDRIFELLDAEDVMKDSPDARPLQGVGEGVRFDHVWFAYNDEQFVLRGIDLLVPAGTICALVGETGAGKSTLLDLVPRFYDPQRGSVRVGGVDVREVTHRSLLEQIAIVGQHPFLFNRSIEENIRYGRRDASRQQVEAAARAAQIHEFITGLPEGYGTAVGEKGSRLSGGQRQCITIARALLKDAPILILDEATSNLDSESEQRVQEALTNLMAGRTTFVIAHRLSTVQFADRIVVLKDGRMVEQGTHKDLLALEGEYAKLHRIQFNTGSGGPEAAPEAAGQESS